MRAMTFFSAVTLTGALWGCITIPNTPDALKAARSDRVSVTFEGSVNDVTESLMQSARQCEPEWRRRFARRAPPVVKILIDLDIKVVSEAAPDGKSARVMIWTSLTTKLEPALAELIEVSAVSDTRALVTHYKHPPSTQGMTDLDIETWNPTVGRALQC